MTKIFKNSNLKSAFTLAEVLITLVIIGVIAAATIPTLLQKHLEHEMITKLKKNFAVLNNAYAQAIKENGAPDEWDMGKNNTYAGAQKIFEYLKPYLKIQKECGNQSGCFASSYKALFSDAHGQTGMDTNTSYYRFVLEDGTAVALRTRGYCHDVIAGGMYSKACFPIYVDLNNKKGPNRAGVDLFLLYATEKSIVAYGIGYPGLATDSQQCAYLDNRSTNGNFCSPHAIYKGNMDYLRRDISPEWQ